MKSRQGKSRRSARGYTRPSPAMKRVIAQWMIDHPDVTPKGVAAELGLNLGLVYKIINQYLEVHTIYTFKRSTEPTE